MEYVYRPSGVCSNLIHVVIEEGIIKKVEFEGGCNGNTTGISNLVKNRNAKEVIQALRGVRCGSSRTSCPDQLSVALEKALQQSK